jgi:hypothetical protein
LNRRLAVVAAAVGAMLGAATPASAGTYNVTACSFAGPGGSNHSWTPMVFRLDRNPPTTDDVKGFQVAGDCASPEGFTIESNLSSRHLATWATWESMVFNAPAGTQIVGLTLSRYSSVARTQTAGGNEGRWERVSLFSDGTEIGGPLGPDQCKPGFAGWPDPCVTGAAGRGADSTVHYDLVAAGLQLGIGCETDTTPLAGCWTTNGAGSPLGFLNFKAARVTLRDTSAPTLRVGGGLTAPGWRRPTDLVTWNASDNVGIRAGRLFLDGVQRGVAAIRCDYSYTVPCPNITGRHLALSGPVADGVHTLQVYAQDAAGNRTVQTRSVSIDGHEPSVALLSARRRAIAVAVRDPFSGVAAGTIAVRDTRTSAFRTLPAQLAAGRLTATLDHVNASRAGIRVTTKDAVGNVTSGQVTQLSLRVRKGRRARAVRHGRVGVGYGRRVRLAGRLTTHDGQPLARARVTVVRTLRMTGARPTPGGTAVTDAKGRLSLRLPAGPSRDLRLTFAGRRDLLPLTRSVSVRVGATSTIRASRRVLGGPGRVRFAGRLGLRGAHVPPSGKLIDLQAFDAGRWRTFGTARAVGRKGRWHFSYRFSGRPGRYPIRVRIRREAAFPYDLGYSRRVVIRVR